MNINDIDLEALQRDLEEFAQQQRQRGWFRRNWLWFVPLLLIVIVVGGGAGIYWAMFTRIHNLEIYQAAMHDIQADPALEEALGKPIRSANWPPPAARLEADEQDLRWNIEGPKATAKAHAAARMMQGKWEIVQLEVNLADGQRINVASSGDSEAEAPTFTAPSGESPTTETTPTGPPPEIHFDIPPADDMGK